MNWRTRTMVAFSLCGFVTWGFMAVYWFALWRRSTMWTVQRATHTVMVAAAAIVAALLVGTITGEGLSNDFGAFVSSVTAPLLWVTGTIFIWRENQAERAARLNHLGKEALVCPACGYNLTGLKEARCPECGAQYTIDELVARQPGKEGNLSESETE